MYVCIYRQDKGEQKKILRRQKSKKRYKKRKIQQKYSFFSFFVGVTCKVNAKLNMNVIVFMPWFLSCVQINGTKVLSVYGGECSVGGGREIRMKGKEKE